MIKIRIFTDFHNLNDDTTFIYLKSSDIKDDPDYNKTFCFTNDNDYTHVILINCPTPNISHIPKQNVIGLAFEPVQFLKGVHTMQMNPSLKLKKFIDYAQKHVGKYYVGDQFDLPEPFVEGCGYLTSSGYTVTPPKKTKLMSIMISNKVFAPGHKYRHILTREILKHDLPIDIYGRGCKYYTQEDARFKGCFDRNEPYEDYKFHIAIENFQCNHWFSEKIMNPLLLNNIPIYLGCRNIHNYFPDSVIKLNGNIDHDIQLIKDICENPEKYTKQIDIDKVKKTISIKNIVDEFSNNTT